jgi:hypothetical protein
MMGATRHARLRRRFYVERVGTSASVRARPSEAYRSTRSVTRAGRTGAFTRGRGSDRRCPARPRGSSTRLPLTTYANCG